MGNLGNQKKRLGEKDINFEKISESQELKHLLKEKKKFLVPLVLFFMVFYFLLPVLTSYTKILNKPAIGSISWTWIYALAQFVMTWVLCSIYVKKSGKFDHLVNQIVENNDQKGDQAI